MKFCVSCGTILEDGDTFCKNCGAACPSVETGSVTNSDLVLATASIENAIKDNSSDMLIQMQNTLKQMKDNLDSIRRTADFFKVLAILSLIAGTIIGIIIATS